MTNTYLDEFRPPQHILLGPGPSSVNPRVLQAMTLPILGHLDPQFFQVMDEVCAMLREVYHTENPMTVPLSSTGTGAMEAACANILEAGDKMIVCRNGFFGDRLADIAERCGAQTVALDFPWGKSVDIQVLADALEQHDKVKAVGVVHAETSTGVLTPLPEIVDLVHRHNALIIVDAVTSLGGHNMRMDEWDLDVCYSATQKCLGSPPGLAPISFGPRAMEVINTRPSKVQSFYFNLKDLENYWNQTRAYHHTMPISMTYALRESLRMMMEEGIDNRIRRHARVASALRAGLEALGMDLMAEEGYQPNDHGPDSGGYCRYRGAAAAAERIQHRDWRRPGPGAGQGLAYWADGRIGPGSQCFLPAVGVGANPARSGLRGSHRSQPVRRPARPGEL